MPELPEVEVVRRGIEPYTSSWTVRQVEVFDPRALKRHEGPVEDFIHTLTGAQFTAAVRRGKFLWLPLAIDSDYSRALLVHLGMSGQLLLGDDIEQFGRLLRVAMHLEADDGDEMILGFVDQRLFGSLAINELVDSGSTHPAGLGSDQSTIPAQARHIARDLMDPHVDLEQFVSSLRRRKTGIKRAILDQQLVSGVGNIYADEALWATKLHYDYPAHRLTAARGRELAKNLQDVFSRALQQGGTSFDWQYVNVNGQSGYFSQSLNAYGQDGQPCSRCGAIIIREPFMNRSSYRCPRCQRTPRKQVS